MDRLSEHHLLQILADSAEPLLIVRLDMPDWPIVFSNAAFEAITRSRAESEFFGDLLDQLLGREKAMEVSDAMHARRASTFAVDIAGREHMLTLKLLDDADSEEIRYCAVYFHASGAVGQATESLMQHALLRAKRTIQDLSRDDAVTGLLNEKAFREMLEHDWAVATRERSTLALVLFRLQDFESYDKTFGRHATDACLRKVGQAIRRCLRRASDVVSRLDADKFVVLSHASEADGVVAFARRIADNVRDLGLHHPKSTVAKFVTVAFEVEVVTPEQESRSPAAMLEELLKGVGQVGDRLDV